ncbi:uncharacterized protein C8Q71DRAFT_699731 [Rhodofomes roseus]|uniref:BRCT domain-containing protein n=1 Tax=Rhodofomes roseus TaxID=34475 RepID=A0ABQ8KW92_9APHY|nr:uncharacterized protein C8Q71DRAFT_699731 [Rhodofomes roseus]KAH9843071.1 hypothetical protein C8Q71DRAFT_699731 [Rhodofomes roseus]
MDDDDDPLRLRPSAAKRKRVTSVTSKGVASKTLARGGKTSNTPLSRSAKKRKVSSSAIVDDASSATRVYALWRQDNHYYSGTVYLMSSVSPPRYEIHFDDGTQDVVDITKMRLCKLLKGDNVLVLKGQKAVVVDVSRFDSDRVATVEIDNGEELDRLDLEVQDIRIASRTLNSAWTNRTLAVEDVCPVMRPHALKNSPSPSKMALGSAASTKSARRLLGKTGFVVTMSPRVDEWEKEKDKIMQAIKGVGGIVIDNWTDVFAMEGALSQSGKRWIAKYDDIRCVVRNDIQRVFLLSDDYNAKPKYLIALALGIPCLDTSWVLHSVGDGQEKDWQQYLLPAGLCESLDTRVSQLVDFDWGNSVEYLRDVTGNQAALRLFAGKRVLCLAPDYVPVAKSRRNNSDADKAKEATRMVPCIILAMGASSVEAVPDVKYASAKNLSEYHYVVVKDRGDIGRVASGPNCVHFGWVKDCLIAGRLLPLPQD